MTTSVFLYSCCSFYDSKIRLARILNVILLKQTVPLSSPLCQGREKKYHKSTIINSSHKASWKTAQRDINQKTTFCFVHPSASVETRSPWNLCVCMTAKLMKIQTLKHQDFILHDNYTAHILHPLISRPHIYQTHWTLFAPNTTIQPLENKLFLRW